MKINLAEEHVKGSHGIAEQKSFAIRTSAHAFKLLSSGLYSDKIKAVLREIGCNATDAHIEYGTPDVPIEVKLPNRIDNRFHIRDFGPGLSHEDVMELYTTYFASTKQTSNDFTGAFGLGSKSPFSYIDSFNVVSAHMGKVRTYSAHLDNTGSPAIALLTTENISSEWEHGVCIEFAVKPGDYPYFSQKAKEVFRWFRVLPRILGDVPVEPAAVVRDFKDFFLTHTEAVPNVALLMGNVLYPMDTSRLNGISKLAAHINSFQGVVLRAPIGSVQVAASREELQYDKESTKYLIKACEEVVRAAAKDTAEFVTRVSQMSWAERCKSTDEHRAWSGTHYEQPHWGNILTLCKYPASLVDCLEAAFSRSYPMPDFAGAGQTTMTRLIRPHRRGTAVSYTGIQHGRTNDKYPQKVILKLIEGTKIVYGTAKHLLPRVRNDILSASTEQLILVTPLPGAPEADAEAEARKLAAHFQNPPLVHVKDLDVPASVLPKGAGGTKAKKPKNAHLLPIPKGSNCSTWDSIANEATLDLSTLAPPTVYMVYQSHSVRYCFRSYRTTYKEDPAYDRWNWRRIWQAFIKLQDGLGIPSARTVAFPKVEMVRRLDLAKRGWVPADVHISQWLSSQQVTGAVAALAAKWQPTMAIPDYPSGWVPTLLHMARHTPQSFDAVAPAIGPYAQELKQVLSASIRAGNRAGKNELEELTTYNRLAADFNLPSLQLPNRSFTTLDDMEDKFCSAFPLTGSFSSSQMLNLKTRPDKAGEFASFLFK